MNKQLTIKSILEGYQAKKLNSTEVFEAFYDTIDSQNEELNAFLTIESKEEKLKQLGPESLPVAHKDIISTEGIETTAASNILKDYVPQYSATIVENLNQAKFNSLGKLNCDAFAHGASGEHSDFGVTKNPYDTTRVAGGSSSGSAAAVAAGMTPVATATDTGGSIRLPASFTNTVGIKPTYGRVSRYGVISMTSSTDSIGHITQTVWDNAYVLGKTAGFDQFDGTTARNDVEDYTSGIDDGVKGLKIGIPIEYVEGLGHEAAKLFQKSIETYKKLGAEIIEDISLPHTEYGINAYYIITPSEISSNLARFDGIRFGHDRSSFGSEAKRRIMMGTYCLSAGYYDAYYKKAQQVRTLIIDDFRKAFEQVDVILGPVSPIKPPKIGENENDPVAEYMMDALTVTVNLAGVPALALPGGFYDDNLPFGIQLIGKQFDEKTLYQTGFAYEQETQYFENKPKL